MHRELTDKDDVTHQLRTHLQQAQERMKVQANKMRREKSFEIKEWVLVKLRAHRQQSVISRINVKLATNYYGPYTIFERLGAVAYRLKIPEGRGFIWISMFYC